MPVYHRLISPTLILVFTACQAAAPHVTPQETPLTAKPEQPPERRPNTPPLDLYAALPPDAAALRDIAHAVCGGAQNVEVVDSRPRCLLCPQQTGEAGREAGELFVRMEQDRALVELSGCEPELYTHGGGTSSLRHAADGWHQLDYWPQVLLRDCEARWFMGAPTLWCTGEGGREGVLKHQLWLVRLEQGRDPEVEWAASLDCSIATCHTAAVDCWSDGAWGQADLDNDGVAELTWDGTHTRWMPVDGADLSQCPPREPPYYIKQERPARLGWRREQGRWIEVPR